MAPLNATYKPPLWSAPPLDLIYVLFCRRSCLCRHIKLSRTRPPLAQKLGRIHRGTRLFQGLGVIKQQYLSVIRWNYKRLAGKGLSRAKVVDFYAIKIRSEIIRKKENLFFKILSKLETQRILIHQKLKNKYLYADQKEIQI